MASLTTSPLTPRLNIAGLGDDFAAGRKALAMPTAAGIYAYKCTIHAGMNGTVQVQ